MPKKDSDVIIIGIKKANYNLNSLSKKNSDRE